MLYLCYGVDWYGGGFFFYFCFDFWVVVGLLVGVEWFVLVYCGVGFCGDVGGGLGVFV